MVEIVDVYENEVAVVSGAILRQLRIAPDGAVTAQIRSPFDAADPFSAAVTNHTTLRFRLADGRTVEFTIFQSAAPGGGWAKLNGRIV